MPNVECVDYIYKMVQGEPRTVLVDHGQEYVLVMRSTRKNTIVECVNDLYRKSGVIAKFGEGDPFEECPSVPLFGLYAKSIDLYTSVGLGLQLRNFLGITIIE